MAYMPLTPNTKGRFGQGINNPQTSNLTRNLTISPDVLAQMSPTSPLLQNNRINAPPPRATAGPSPPTNIPQATWGGGGGQQAGDTPLRRSISEGRGDFRDYTEGPEIPDYVGPGGGMPEYVGANYTSFDPTRWQDDARHVAVRDVVDASRHYLDEEMMGNMAEASRRFGGSGAIRSSGHLGALTDAERKRDRDLGEMYHRYAFQAGEGDANRGLQAWQAHQDAMAREAARRTGFDVGQAAGQTAHNVTLAGLERQDAASENAYNRFAYGAGMDETRRRAQYEQDEWMWGL